MCLRERETEREIERAISLENRLICLNVSDFPSFKLSSHDYPNLWVGRCQDFPQGANRPTAHERRGWSLNQGK